jgi:hypothetical protein
VISLWIFKVDKIGSDGESSGFFIFHALKQTHRISPYRTVLLRASGSQTYGGHFARLHLPTSKNLLLQRSDFVYLPTGGDTQWGCFLYRAARRIQAAQ